MLSIINGGLIKKINSGTFKIFSRNTCLVHINIDNYLFSTIYRFYYFYLYLTFTTYASKFLIFFPDDVGIEKSKTSTDLFGSPDKDTYSTDYITQLG